VYDIGHHLPDAPGQCPDLKSRIGGFLALAYDPYAVAGQPIRIRSKVPDCIDHVLEAVRIQPVNQIYEPVFQSPFPEVIHYVHDPDRHKP
jgi:hypothetical protein